MKQKPKASFHPKIFMPYPQECTTVAIVNILPCRYTVYLLIFPKKVVSDHPESTTNVGQKTLQQIGGW